MVMLGTAMALTPSIYDVALVQRFFLQFSSGKMVENWLSYAHVKFWGHTLKTGVTIITGLHESQTCTRDDCDTSFECMTPKLDMGITQSILHHFAWKKLQKESLNKGYILNTHKPAKPAKCPCNSLAFLKASALPCLQRQQSCLCTFFYCICAF